MKESYAIETRHLTKRYGEQVAVNDVCLHVPKGHIYGLLGAEWRRENQHHEVDFTANAGYLWRNAAVRRASEAPESAVSFSVLVPSSKHLVSIPI